MIILAREQNRKFKDAEKMYHMGILNICETYKGFLYTWENDAYVSNAYLIGMSAGPFSSLYGVVEFEDGTIHKVDPESITFIDRD